MNIINGDGDKTYEILLEPTHCRPYLKLVHKIFKLQQQIRYFTATGGHPPSTIQVSLRVHLAKNIAKDFKCVVKQWNGAAYFKKGTNS